MPAMLAMPSRPDASRPDASRPPDSDSGGDLALRFYPVTSADGTRLEAWTNDVDGPAVLLCNGLGTNPYAWPALLDPACGLRVLSWNHRGVGGSQRPADPDRVGIEHFVEDALAVLDDADVGACPVAGWSIGVNTSFELALRHPHRVSGLFAVAGVPGGTLASVGAPLFLPRPVRRPVSRAVVRALGRLSPVLSPATTRLPMGPLATWLLQHSGLMFPGADPEVVARAVRTYLDTPLDWGMHLVRVTDQHGRVSLSSIDKPALFVSGHRDLLASTHDMRTAAQRMRDAEFVELDGSHFVQMERPGTVHELLLDFVRRVG